MSVRAAHDPRRAQAVQLLRRLREAGHHAYFAGGCVRDACLGLHPKDYDIATSARPEQVAALLPRCQMVGKAFGVVLSRPSREQAVEVATFRTDGAYSDGRRPDEVTFGSAEDDARRRDFTINGLFADPLDPQGDGADRVIDFVGGLADLRAGVLRAIGEPDRRFGEDFLRLLRAVRFAVRLDFHIEEHTWAAMRRHAPSLERIARERIGDEMRRMLSGPRPALAARLLTGSGLASVVLRAPVAAPAPRLEALAPAAAYPTRLAAWLLDLGHPADAAGVEAWRSCLNLSNDERDRLAGTLRLSTRLADWQSLGTAARKRLLADALAGEARLLLAAGADPALPAIARDAETLAADGVGIAPPPFLGGQDLIGLGLKPSPEFKRWLEEAYDLQLEGRLADAAAARAWARARAGPGGV